MPRSNRDALVTVFVCRALLLLLILVIIGSHEIAGSSSANPNTVGVSEIMGRFGLLGAIKPNPYVAASPLIIAAECSDGIVLIATHTASKEEKLLRVLEDDDDEQTHNRTVWNEFQYGRAGPSRIRRIDRFGTHLLSAGWRADCDLLGDKLCSLASKEVSLFGRPLWGLPYGRHLAEEATYFLAQHGVSPVRLPSCIGLLAACGNRDDSNNNNNDYDDGAVGSLWMIDANGWYRLKSLAVGGGPAPENDKNCTVLAQLVNDQLQDLDSREMTTDEAITHILAILGGGEEIDGNGTAPLLSHDCEIEIAYTNAKTGGRLHRQSLKSFTAGTKEPIS